MNEEEELKKEINVGISYTNPNRVWKAIGDLEDLSFQKGKLEKIKEEIEWLDYILREINIDLTIENLIHIRIKQLQKEIGEEKE